MAHARTRSGVSIENAKQGAAFKGYGLKKRTHAGVGGNSRIFF
jgi:hypothetical protein